MFAYGSLLWNPLFPFAEARPAMLRGLHRQLLPVFDGVARHARHARTGVGDSIAAARAPVSRTGLPAPVAIDELHLLWRREMVVGSYHPKWVGVHAGDRQLVALAFTVKHDHPQYAGKLPIEEQARVIANAAGAFGSSLDYLERTRVALVTHGIVDPYLEALAARVAVLRACSP